MLKLLRYLKKWEGLQVFCGFLFICAQVWLDLTMPEYMADITALVQTAGSTMGEILSAGGKSPPDTVFQTAAARDFHAGQGNGANGVGGKNFRQLFFVLNRV